MSPRSYIEPGGRLAPLVLPLQVLDGGGDAEVVGGGQGVAVDDARFVHGRVVIRGREVKIEFFRESRCSDRGS